MARKEVKSLEVKCESYNNLESFRVSINSTKEIRENLRKFMSIIVACFPIDFMKKTQNAIFIF